METIKLGSLFSGSGGFELGGLLAGIEPIWNSEIEPFPIRVTTKRLPQVKHYGDIRTLSGHTLEPVDIITFGSPCTDMSIAGKRAGLEGKQSILFYEAIRIIKEMREKTNGKQPRYIVWENVPGAFTSNGGEDFRTVLKEICGVKDGEISVPRCEKWKPAGEIVGDDFSVAWRTLDAAYWGVPQRRKRIYLVADFTGSSAGQVLFESEGVSRYSAQSFRAWQAATGAARTGAASTSTVCLNDQGGREMRVTEDLVLTLRAEARHPPIIMLNSTSLVFDNHGADSRITGPLTIGNTITARYGTGGNNQPLVLTDADTAIAYDIRQTSEGTRNARHHIYESTVSRCLDCSGNLPGSNQGGLAVVEDVYSSSKASFFTRAQKNTANALVATNYKEPPIVSKSRWVRRLTPVECARLQGFPDWWCSQLETPNATEEDVVFWQEVFETQRKALGKTTKPRSERQIRKWLQQPYSDAAAYRMWGNGVALPCVFFVLAGIAHYYDVNTVK